MGVSSAYITKMLKELVDIGVLKRGCKGVYILA
jgi:Mn-dependent DtxR family transcriptional regulator